VESGDVEEMRNGTATGSEFAGNRRRQLARDRGTSPLSPGLLLFLWLVYWIAPTDSTRCGPLPLQAGRIGKPRDLRRLTGLCIGPMATLMPSNQSRRHSKRSVSMWRP
jgi:hypothetical protein